ncbi:MAG: 50S ribosomal protein L10 [Alphaproteobacteria bacterium]|nr:50S ribosomal protein L10 [Alphaproteobacteria bacterium]MDA8003465.1 50S ribosomal protein L10 [Alphaproteobacteria bacterium]MDA8005065.1 50S ribosomal protein L10 [Alphaproteobacteria bacterium]MDA8012481.1 50S ribosomal protein L10 [Alphaproteobacteria bacterium]
MAIRRAEKEVWIDDFRRDVADAPFVLVASPRGLKVAEITDLRRRVREDGAGFRYVRNRLAARALRDTPNEPLIQLFESGERAVAYAREGVSVSKICSEYAKEWEERFEIIGGVMDGERMTAADMEALARLPGMDVLRGQIVGLLQASAGKLARVLLEPSAVLARVTAAAGRKES